MIRTMIDNFVNGNLSDAKRQAKRFSMQTIYNALRQDGYSHIKAYRTAYYLKCPSQETYQMACDAE